MKGRKYPGLLGSGFGGILYPLLLPMLVWSNALPPKSESSDEKFDSQTLLNYDDDQPWIGSHALNFSPNPFLVHTDPIQQSNNGSTNFSLINQPVHAQDYVPSSTIPQHSGDINSLIKPKSGYSGNLNRKKKMKRLQNAHRKKIKGRRQSRRTSKMHRHKYGLLRRKSKVKVSFPRYMNNDTLSSLEEVEEDAKVLPKKYFVNTKKIKLVPIDQVSLNPTYRFQNVRPVHQEESPLQTTSSSDMILVTPEPTKAEVVESQNTPVQIDYMAHPEKLNPSYFRNIILKAMMDKLVTIGVATHAPGLMVPVEEFEKKEEMIDIPRTS